MERILMDALGAFFVWYIIFCFGVYAYGTHFYRPAQKTAVVLLFFAVLGSTAYNLLETKQSQENLPTNDDILTATQSL